MGGFLENMKRQLSSFMQGRYGIDQLSSALVFSGLAITVIGMLSGFDILSYLSLVILASALFRAYSKNIPQRTKELSAYQKAIKKPQAWFSLMRRKWDNRATTRYFKCKGCGAVLSIPIGKGTIKTTCPHCKNQTVRKS